jgi:hypothetical protein
VRELDGLLPNYDHHEVYAVDVEADAATAMATFLATPVAPDVVTLVLFRLRGLRPNGTIVESLTRLGFTVLQRDPTQVVLGVAGRPWTPAGGMHDFAAARPGDVRVAVDIRATPIDGGRCVLSTETRIQATDEASRRAFTRYWRVVRPFSGVVRRRWLRAAANAARR